jgi:hypothetical protein
MHEKFNNSFILSEHLLITDLEIEFISFDIALRLLKVDKWIVKMITYIK